MEPDVPIWVKIAALTSEMDNIHSANCLYWRRGEAVTLDARAEYQHRKQRLDQIRKELAQLRDTPLTSDSIHRASLSVAPQTRSRKSDTT